MKYNPTDSPVNSRLKYQNQDNCFSAWFPSQNSLPQLLGPVQYTDSTDTFYFECRISYPICYTDTSARFVVHFWADDEAAEVTLANVTDVNCTQPFAQLDHLLLKGHLGKSVIYDI